MSFESSKKLTEPNNSLERKEKLTAIYNDDGYITLYRYENSEHSYDKKREGKVSKKDIVGTWFCDDLKDLKDYVYARTPGGNLITIRVEKDLLHTFNSQLLQETREMDIEKGNYNIPLEKQLESRIEIPLEIENANSTKFIFNDFSKVNNFIDEHLSTSEKILKHVK